MVGLTLLVFSSVVALASAMLLALSQDRHWRKVAPKTSSKPSFLRPAGWSLAALCLVLCVLRDGGSFAALVWPMLMAGACIGVAMLLAFLPNVMGRLASVLSTNS